jgi:two-component system, OmpR family, sensor histidine kinase MprB
MTFRRRLALAAAAAVAAAVLLGCVATFLIVSSELHSQLDDSLEEMAAPLLAMNGQRPARLLITPPERRNRLGGPMGYLQVVTRSGRALRPQGLSADLPVDARTRRLAGGAGDAFFRNARVGSTNLRIYSVAVPQPGRSDVGAVQIARPLEEIEAVLGRLRWILAGVLVLGVALALVLGRLVARTAIAPVSRLTEASEHVARTGDLSRRISTGSPDELGRLAATFNTMLDALERSVRALDESVVAQRQLVADASHELRTPLTSLRTNIDVLAVAEQLGPEERARLLEEVTGQLEELTVLMDDLIQLARGDERLEEVDEVRLDLLAREAIDRFERHSRDVRFEAVLQPSVVEGVPERLDRAVANLLDNAAKWSPPGGVVEVSVGEGALTVRDHGPGIAAKDLHLIFDRFYRADEARGVAGSGLGLAIVRQVAESHGGQVTVEQPTGGGTRFRLSL